MTRHPHSLPDWILLLSHDPFPEGRKPSSVLTSSGECTMYNAQYACIIREICNYQTNCRVANLLPIYSGMHMLSKHECSCNMI